MIWCPVLLTLSFANHENSKKHKENIALLRAHMQEEEGLQEAGSGEEVDLDDLEENFEDEAVVAPPSPKVK